MPFKKLLNELVETVPGGRGAIIVDWEGEAVDQAGPMDEYELKLVGAHKGVILHNLRDVVGRLGKEDLQEVVVTTRNLQILILPVTVDYFLVVALSPGDILGRALFESRRCVDELKKEIA